MTVPGLALGLAVAATLSQAASADEVRHTTFSSAVMGTWALTADQCAAKDKSNIRIEAAKYGNARESCDVRWIVETASPNGPNYSVHAQCTNTSKPPKTQVENILIRPQGNDRLSFGNSFEELKTYQRCPTQ
jgi:hypothetical protein